mgnify:CR=1 FL=1
MILGRVASPYAPIPSAAPFQAQQTAPQAGAPVPADRFQASAPSAIASLYKAEAAAAPKSPVHSYLAKILASTAIATTVVCGLLAPHPAVAAPLSHDTVRQTMSLDALIASLNTSSTPTQAVAPVDLNAHPLQQGMSGISVQRFQQGLARYMPGVKASGTFDEQTENAVRAFQKSNNLPETGKVDNHTYGVLWNRSFWEKGISLDLNDPAFYQSVPGKMTLKADLKAHRVSLVDAESGRVVKVYPFSNGSARYPTPTGSFKIGQVTEKPIWHPPTTSDWARGAKPVMPGPNNPLGPASLRLGTSTVLFHGVPRNEWSGIGKAAQSHGCMRMFPQDAWELHKIVPVGTPVEVN